MVPTYSIDIFNYIAFGKLYSSASVVIKKKVALTDREVVGQVQNNSIIGPPIDCKSIMLVVVKNSKTRLVSCMSTIK